MAHGGFLTFIADTGMGNAAHQVAGNKRCVTISLEMKFISAGKLGDKLIAKVKVQKKTNTLVFLTVRDYWLARCSSSYLRGMENFES